MILTMQSDLISPCFLLLLFLCLSSAAFPYSAPFLMTLQPFYTFGTFASAAAAASNTSHAMDGWMVGWRLLMGQTTITPELSSSFEPIHDTIEQ